ncbi:MAG: ABC transporter permease subunit [Anaerolineae bacterium]|nr:ABC transporter permease subunit [Anaerolineae bacterium]
MTANSVFTPIAERGWRRGLHNLLRAGFAEWWATNTWWVHALIWSGVFNLMVAGIVFSGEVAEAIDAVGFLCVFGGLFPVVAAVIILQGAIVGEKQNGTAEWILSKPVSRTAYILGKLIPNAVSMPVAMLLIPMLVGWVVLNLAGVGTAILPFLAGYLIVALNLLLFITLTVMLGAMLKRRGGVIAIPLVLLLGQQYLLGAFPFLANFLPWGLTIPAGEDATSSVAASVMLGQAPSSWGPVIVAAVAIGVFVVVAVDRFRAVEI